MTEDSPTLLPDQGNWSDLAVLVREWVRYNPETGAFTWRKSGPYKKAGAKAAHRASGGYCRISLYNRLVYAHRAAFVLMLGRWPAQFADHVDGDPSNNKWSNLREATLQQNNHNAKRPRTNKTGVKGVSYLKTRGVYRARAWVNGRQRSLGCYETAEQAHAAYCKAVKEHRGVFGRTR